MKRVTFTEGGYLDLPRSACVTKGDHLEIRGRTAEVLCHNGKARLLPIYVASERLSVGGLTLELVVKEITEDEEFDAYQVLTQHHYRGRALRGRTAKLIVLNFHPVYPAVIGYIELATPFYMNRARAAVLDAPFRVNGTSWKSWDMASQRRFTNLNVRVARCVIAPEFRGLGLGQVLVKHAAAFSRDRWQVAGLKPYFLEISADMLKYVPFAERAGMTFVGETQGNLARVAKDVEYLLQNRARVDAGAIVKEEAFGIVDQQVARMNRAASIIDRMGWGVDDLVERLSRSMTAMSLRDAALLHELLSLPKPTFMQGLNVPASEFLRRRAKTLGLSSNGDRHGDVSVHCLAGVVELDDLTLEYTTRVRRTSKTHAIQQAFGISPDDFRHTVLERLSLKIGPGEVVLITGASGSGKTSLINFLLERFDAKVGGEFRRPANYRPGAFSRIASRRPLIDALGSTDTAAALRLMGRVGLSDAFVYLKRFDELSNGQQYRAMLAKLMVGGRNVWIADEFCSTLDPLTANVVAERVQATAREVGASLIVASSNPESMIAALRPDKVVRLGTGLENCVISGSEFVRMTKPSSTSFGPPVLKVPLSVVIAARRMSAEGMVIRTGRMAIKSGWLLLTSGPSSVLVRVTTVERRRVGGSAREELDKRSERLNRKPKNVYSTAHTSNAWVTEVKVAPPC